MDEPLPVLFVREAHGVYGFGIKRIYLKIEQGKLIVKIGGGFMTMDEFVEVYTPLE